MMRASAIIVAAGSGERIKSSIPKPYIDINGYPILYHTVNKFLKSQLVSGIVIVISRQFINSEIVNACVPASCKKAVKFVEGGRTRQESVYNGLKSLEGDVDIVVIHDGVRPFIEPELIDKTIEMCNYYDGSILATQSVDTLKEVDGLTAVKTLNRENIWQVQTPQTFRREILEKAYKKAFELKFEGTDDSSLAELIGAKIGIIEGSPKNFKITSPEDLQIAISIAKSLGV